MPSPVSLEDLHWLRDAIPQLDADPDTAARVKEWVETAISVRVAQQTKSKTQHHADLMQAYNAAKAQWTLCCENATNGYAAEVQEFREQHPMPTLKAFMRAARRVDTVQICRFCGSPIITEDDQ